MTKVKSFFDIVMHTSCVFYLSIQKERERERFSCQKHFIQWMIKAPFQQLLRRGRHNGMIGSVWLKFIICLLWYGNVWGWAPTWASVSITVNGGKASAELLHHLSLSNMVIKSLCILILGAAVMQQVVDKWVLKPCLYSS